MSRSELRLQEGARRAEPSARQGEATATEGAGPEPVVIWTTEDWARAILALPVEGALPARTALVPSGRVAHALRRELLRMGRAHGLAGTRFVPLAAAAAEVLRAAGAAFTPGEEALREARLRALFRQEMRLEVFDLDLLRRAPGWEQAFARAIGDLEAAALTPEELGREGHGPRERDVATIWSALDRAAGRSLTAARAIAEAARALRADPECWPFEGAALGVAAGDLTAAERDLLLAVPRLTLGVLAGRPRRRAYLARVEALLGPAAARALRGAAHPPPRRARAGGPRGELADIDVLASYLFEEPRELGREDRPRSRGPDGTVLLEEHAGVDEEIEAAAAWVAEQIAARTPLEEIGLIVPAIDPWASLLESRLSRWPWPEGGSIPIHVAGGVPLVGTAAGARALALVRALQGHLALEALAELAPALRTASGGHLSRREAIDLLGALGTAGGSPAHPAGALSWSARIAARGRDLDALAAGASGPAAEAAARRVARLREVRPAIEALVGVARLCLEGGALPEVWPALRAALDGHLLAPAPERGAGAGPGPASDEVRGAARPRPAQAAPSIGDLLHEALAGLCEDPSAGALRGHDALDVIEAAILARRVPAGRFGDPAVFIGTPREARGLGLRAVRVLGLAEGRLPASPREDPVLPERTRGSDERVLSELHDLDRAVRDARVLSLSTSRLDLTRSQREPSSVFVEAAAALGRPAGAGGGAAARALPRAAPLTRGAWLDRAAAAPAAGVPAAWLGAGELDLVRVLALAAAEGGPDGALSSGAALDLPGLTPARPISAHGLALLLECPRRFLLEVGLGLREPAAPPLDQALAADAYGRLVHRAVEAFYRAHGEAFGRRERGIEAWEEEADAIAAAALSAHLEASPLAGAALRDQQRARLRRDLRLFLSHDWCGGRPRRFLAVEEPFGAVPSGAGGQGAGPGPAGVAIDAGGAPLYVSGIIDRLDVDGDRLLVRDLKTGRCRPRAADPIGVEIDLQIALYGIVSRPRARELGLAGVGAAYAYTGLQACCERAFHDDFDALEGAARRWLAIAADLLRARRFPHTPRDEDCRRCPFQPACAGAARGRAQLADPGAPAALRGLAEIKGCAGAEPGAAPEAGPR